MPTLYEIAAFGSPVFESRMKYRDACGPVVVTVQSFTCRCQESATPSQTAADAVSPFARASSAAATRPAMLAAIVDGE